MILTRTNEYAKICFNDKKIKNKVFMPRRKISELLSLPLFLKFGQLLRPFLQLKNHLVKLLSCFLILLFVYHLNQLPVGGLDFQNLSLQQADFQIGLIGQSFIGSEIGNKDTWKL